MASANNGHRAAAGLLPFLFGMAMTSSPASRQGLVMVHHVILNGDGDLSSGGVPPASKASIAALKEVKAGEEDEGEERSLGECVICLDAVEEGKEMPCGHRFHGECLERWLGVRGSCPVCRYELPPSEDDGARRRGPAAPARGAVVVSYVVVGGGGEERREEGREAPWTVRIEDVD